MKQLTRTSKEEAAQYCSGGGGGGGRAVYDSFRNSPEDAMEIDSAEPA